MNLAPGSRVDCRVAARHSLCSLKRIVVLAMLCGIALSPALWSNTARTFPLAPVSEAWPVLPAAVEAVWVAILLALLVASLIVPSARSLTAAFVVLAIPFALFDQNRWQPWFFQYLLMLSALALPSRSAGHDSARQMRSAISTCRVIVAAVYFWSGVQKLDGEFAAAVAPELWAPVAAAIPVATLVPTPLLAWIVPFVEILIGFGLLIGRFTRAVALLALCLHASIVFVLGIGLHNTVVWPWNVAMAMCCVSLCHDRAFSLTEWLGARRTAFGVATAILVGVLPAFGVLGLWDAFPSFSVYSGRTHVAVLRFDASLREQLPVHIRPLALAESADRFVLPLDRWASADLNVPAYPEARVSRQIARQLCARIGAPRDLRLELFGAPQGLSGRRSIAVESCRSYDDQSTDRVTQGIR